MERRRESEPPPNGAVPMCQKQRGGAGARDKVAGRPVRASSSRDARQGVARVGVEGASVVGSGGGVGVLGLVAVAGLVELAVDRARRDAEELGGEALVAAGVLEGLGDDAQLDLLEW